MKRNGALVGRLTALVAALLLASPAAALIVGGGGSRSGDCLAVFEADANQPAARPRHVRCVDGDPSCDADGQVDGACLLRVSVCVNSTHEPSCSLAGVQSIAVANAVDDGDPRFDPDFQALQTRIDTDLLLPTEAPDQCSGSTLIRVPIRGPVGKSRCRPSRKKLQVTTLSQVIDGRIYKDRDRINLICVPHPQGCDPQALFSGTFDRLQRQVFNQSCAVSGCHDSQSQASGLLLEVGAAHGELVDQLPGNLSAFLAGWRRVDTSGGGSSPSSFLYRKVTGDLPDASYGGRMPLGRPKLHKTLREVVRLWIEAGAPATGWVPGTD